MIAVRYHVAGTDTATLVAPAADATGFAAMRLTRPGQ
jgi:hypothetical protein